MANADAPNENLMESGSSVFWLTDPQKAWKLASLQKRPILAQFYAPRIPTYAYLKSITPNDEETKSPPQSLRAPEGGREPARRRHAGAALRHRPGADLHGHGSRRQGTETRIPVAGNQTKWSQIQGELNTATAPQGLAAKPSS
jgi:hypothetical protein